MKRFLFILLLLFCANFRLSYGVYCMLENQAHELAHIAAEIIYQVGTPDGILNFPKSNGFLGDFINKTKAEIQKTHKKLILAKERLNNLKKELGA